MNSLTIEICLMFSSWLDWPCEFWGGFPGDSAGKESSCNAGDPGSISGSGRSPGEGIGYPLQYPWVSPVAQMVKNLPAVQETWVRSLGWDPGGGHGNPLQYSCLENPHVQRSLVGYSPWGQKELDTTEWLSTYTHTGFRVENCRGKVPFWSYYIKGTCLLIWYATAAVDLDRMGEVELVSFLLCEALLSPSLSCFPPGQKSLHVTYTSGVGSYALLPGGRSPR